MSMNSFKALAPEKISGNAIERIGKEWMLLAAEKDGRVNMMTASWGGLGVLWGKPVAFTFFRPQRYTFEYLSSADTFSATFFDASYRETLNFCGTKSGRDVDKVKECGFTVLRDSETPYFAEGSLALILRKLYVQRLDPVCFIDKSLDEANYPKKDYHYMVVGEIVNTLQKI